MDDKLIPKCYAVVTRILELTDEKAKVSFMGAQILKYTLMESDAATVMEGKVQFIV